MDFEKENYIYSNNYSKLIKNENLKYILKLFIIFILPFIVVDILINIEIYNFSLKSNVKMKNMFLNFKNDLSNSILGLKNFKEFKTIKIEIEDFNDINNAEYKQNQNEFCNNENEYYNREFENKIKLSKIIFKNITYFMYIYKQKDIVSSDISKINAWEKYETNNLIKGLDFYKKKK